VQDLWIQKDDFDDEEYVARSYGVGFTIGSRGYVTIGDGSTTVWEYNPTDDSWSDLGVFEGGSRQRAVGFAINGKGYISTGLNGSTYFDDLWEFDPTIEQDTDDN
jgi:N-acetylneuraminic acid mutarotase